MLIITYISSMETALATWSNVAEILPESGPRVMLVSSKFPSGYPVFAVLRYNKNEPYWRLMPSRLNADFGTYDLWAYTNQPVNPHDPLFAQKAVATPSLQ